jgi:hypothetical protein
MPITTTTLWQSAFGVLWIGGWGFVFYRYPTLIARIGSLWIQTDPLTHRFFSTRFLADSSIIRA